MAVGFAAVLLGPALVYGTELDRSVAQAADDYDASPREPVKDGNAPCNGCLSATAAIEVALIYLDRAEIRYIGQPRAELLADFPWRGGKGLRWWLKGDIPDPWSDKKRSIEYGGEQGLAIGALRSPIGEKTWRVWYQTGWLGVDRINKRVDDGTLPLEALAWPPIKLERSLLVHSLTGELAKTRDEVIDHASDAFYRRHEEAKAAARQRAKTFLMTLASDGDHSE